MPAIEVKNLTKEFKGLKAVDSISFEVKEGEIFAFLGPNGAGKTTTIKMLTTLLHPTSGEMRLNGYDPVLNPDNAKDDLVKHFSGGMKRRLEIARGLLHHPKILFLDEPTLGLDPQTRTHIWSYIKNLNKEEGITIFFTTHYMEEADRAAQRKDSN